MDEIDGKVHTKLICPRTFEISDRLTLVLGHLYFIGFTNNGWRRLSNKEGFIQVPSTLKIHWQFGEKGGGAV